MQTICAGQGISVSTHIYNSPGVYRDTFATTGCDSIHILNLMVTHVKHDTIEAGFCEGESLVIGGHSYTQAGTFTDTCTTTYCDSIVSLHVSIYPNPVVHATASSTEVLPGDKVQLNLEGASLPVYYCSTVNLDSGRGYGRQQLQGFRFRLCNGYRLWWWHLCSQRIYTKCRWQ